MALSRSFLKGMGLTEEQVSAIIEAHTDTVDGLKSQRDEYKTKAEQLDSVQAELDKLKADGGNWEEKYNAEHKAFEDFKTEQTNKDNALKVSSAYKELLKSAGVAESLLDDVLKVTDLSTITLADDGKINDSDKLTESIKTKWSNFIVDTEKGGAPTPKPPKNEGGNVDLSTLSMEDYIAARTKK